MEVNYYVPLLVSSSDFNGIRRFLFIDNLSKKIPAHYAGINDDLYWLICLKMSAVKRSGVWSEDRYNKESIFLETELIIGKQKILSNQGFSLYL